MIYIEGVQEEEKLLILEEREEIEEAIYKMDYKRRVYDGNIAYLETYGTFDIETTSMEDYGFMYIAMFCIGDDVFMVRRWEDVLFITKSITKHFRTNYHNRFVLYVHSLPFEFQFMRNYFDWEEVFSVKERIPVRALTVEGIEFRCSYKLTNMSLSKFCEKTKGVVHYKQSGKGYNYSKVRTCDTELTESEYLYCYCDVKGLKEGLDTLLKEDNLATIPMTSTGYVRRDCREAMRSNKYNHELIKSCEIDSYLYTLLRTARRGGDTAANPVLVGEMLENVRSKDIISSYIYIMMTKKFPMGKWIEDSCKNMIDDRAYLMRVKFINIRVKDRYMIGYISKHKVSKISRDFVQCNGRIVRADSLTCIITEVDLRIINTRYTYDEMEILGGYSARTDYLPKELREQIMHYFKLKCELKNEDAYLYNRSKNKLNSIFGMMLTDICNDNVIYNGEWGLEKVNVDEALKKYFNSRNSFLSYSWGVYVTAYARERLNEPYIENRRFAVYCDTDCWKLLDGYNESIFVKINEKIKKEAEYFDVKPYWEDKETGTRFYLGLWEDEGMYDKYKTLGAKKYCYEKNGEITVTVSGLSKSSGSSYLQNNLQGIESFVEGTIFPPEVSGRTYSVYDDRREIRTITIDGATFTTGSSIAIHNTSYTLDRTAEYSNLTKEIKRYGLKYII